MKQDTINVENAIFEILKLDPEIISSSTMCNSSKIESSRKQQVR
jgi:hypothetical protein